MYNWLIVFFNALAGDLIPPLIRKPKQVAWLSALVAPLQTTFDSFVTYYNNLLVKARYNIQFIVLTAALNREFPNTVTILIIYIVQNSINYDEMYFFNTFEGIPALYIQYFFNQSEAIPEYFYNETEYIPVFDYTVHVPAGYVGTNANWQAEITAFVNKYNQLGYTFEVVTP